MRSPNKPRQQNCQPVEGNGADSRSQHPSPLLTVKLHIAFVRRRILPLPRRFDLVQLPFYYGWVNLVVAAVAMVATLPGRTHGLGLVTEPLLQDLHIEPVTYAQITLCAPIPRAPF